MGNKKTKGPKCLMVPYYRVSTDRQGESGLGLDAQRAIVERLAKERGCAIPAEFTEIESGKLSDIDRPELVKAIAHAKRIGATLIIAKLDRLSRKASFILLLVESGLDVLFGDMPHLNAETSAGKFQLTMMAAAAEYEGKVISERTKAALESYRSQKRVSKRIRERYPNGIPEEVIAETAGKLGAEIPECRNLTDDARKKGRDAQVNQAKEAYASIASDVSRMRKDGMTLRAIADELNARGITTRTGTEWCAVKVKRVLERSAIPSDD